MLDSCKMPQKQSEAFHTFLWYFSKFKTGFYRSSKVSDSIFEIHNQALVGCIPIRAVAVHLKLKS